MRILCDQMINESYVRALSVDDRHTVARVRDRLAPDATDDAITAHATRNDWVILTADDDYLAEDTPHGLLFYDDEHAPSPGAVRDAIQQINCAYDDHTAVIEWAPGEWT